VLYAAVDLPFGQKGVDDRAGVVDRSEPPDRQRAGLALDLDHRRVGAGAEHEVGLEPRLGLEARGGLGPRDRATIRPDPLPPYAADLLDPAVQQSRGHACGGLQNPRARLHQRRAAHGHRAAGECPDARDLAEPKLDIADFDSETIRHDLRKRGLVSLTVWA